MLRSLGLVLLCPVLLCAEEKLARHEFAEVHMGTQFQLVLYAPSKAKAVEASKAAFQRIAFLDATMNDYRPSSELMKLCEKAGGEPVPVSQELFFVLRRAEEVSRLSDGAFDATIRPVVRLWRLSRRTQKFPKPEKLKQARSLVDYRNVRLDAKKQTVHLTKTGIQLDLGGIAKGYAADEAHKALRKHGITRALVAAGGDVTVSDAPPGKKGWQIAIAAVDPERDPKMPKFLLSNASVSTSGDLNQYVEIEGQRYSHIVDPRTGIGLPGRMSVTVISDTGTTSDSYATAISILGPAKGMKLAKQKGLEVRFVRVMDGKKKIDYTSDFPKFLDE